MLQPRPVTIQSQVPFAGEELARYLGMLPGCRTGKTGYPIHVRVTGTGGEDYTVSVSQGRADISGGSVRGAVYGTYAFLEKCLGFRFLAEDCEIIPGAFPELEACSFHEAPAFEYRDAYWRGALDGTFALKMRLNSARADIPPERGGRVMFYNYSHTFEQLVPAEEFFDTHPEYFSMVSGVRQQHNSQLCLTNPDVLRIVTGRVRGWMRAYPDHTIFSVAMNDWYSPCECPSCKALDEREESHAGTMIAFVNAVADAVRDEFPKNRIHTFAYLYCRKPPRALRPRANVIVRLCSIESCFSHPLSSCDHAVDHIDVQAAAAQPFARAPRLFRQDLDEWSKICDSLYIWDYTTNFANYLQPFPNIHVIGPNLRLFRDRHVRGVFEQGNYSPGRASAFAPLKIYLISKLLWDPDEDAEELTERFVRGYYGEAAAGPLLRYLSLSAQAAQGAHMSLFDGVSAPYLDSSFVREGTRLMESALERAADPAHIERIRREALSLRYVSLSSLAPDTPGRDAMIDAFAADAIELGISELFERRELNASFDCMKKSRCCTDRGDVPYAVYRI